MIRPTVNALFTQWHGWPEKCPYKMPLFVRKMPPEWNMGEAMSKRKCTQGYICIYTCISIYGIVKPHMLINQHRFWTLSNWVSLLPRCTLSAPSRTETNFKTTAFCSWKAIISHQNGAGFLWWNPVPSVWPVWAPEKWVANLRAHSRQRSPVCHAWVSSKSTSHHGLCLCMSIWLWSRTRDGFLENFIKLQAPPHPPCQEKNKARQSSIMCIGPRQGPWNYVLISWFSTRVLCFPGTLDQGTNSIFFQGQVIASCGCPQPLCPRLHLCQGRLLWRSPQQLHRVKPPGW